MNMESSFQLLHSSTKLALTLNQSVSLPTLSLTPTTRSSQPRRCPLLFSTMLFSICSRFHVSSTLLEVTLFLSVWVVLENNPLPSLPLLFADKPSSRLFLTNNTVMPHSKRILRSSTILQDQLVVQLPSFSLMLKSNTRLSLKLSTLCLQQVKFLAFS